MRCSHKVIFLENLSEDHSSDTSTEAAPRCSLFFVSTRDKKQHALSNFDKF